MSRALTAGQLSRTPAPCRAARQGPALPRWWVESAVVLAMYAAYDATRGLRHGSVATADRNGQLILHWEHIARLAPEHPLNQLLWHLPPLAVLASYFYATLHFIITPAVLIWLYRCRPQAYRRARSTIMIATGVALTSFWLVPTTPPRLLAGSHIRDTLAEVHQWGWWSATSSAPHGLGGLANDYAAMPSLHVAWSLWAGWLIAHHARSTPARVAGVTYPILTALVVMGTGNHYLLDVLAGAAVTAAASLIVIVATRRPSVTATISSARPWARR
jgi:hypothetical protein